MTRFKYQKNQQIYIWTINFNNKIQITPRSALRSSSCFQMKSMHQKCFYKGFVNIDFAPVYDDKQKKAFKVLLYPSLTPQNNFSLFTNDIYKNVRPFEQIGFQKRIKQVKKQSQKKRTINIYRPRRSNHMRCDVCRLQVQDQFQHAQTIQHKQKLSSCIGTFWIHQLCQQYKCLFGDYQTKINEKLNKTQKIVNSLKKNCVVQNDIPKEAKERKQYPSKKQKLKNKKSMKQQLLKKTQQKTLNVSPFQAKDISSGIFDLLNMKSLNTGPVEQKKISKCRKSKSIKNIVNNSNNRDYHEVVLKPIQQQY